MRIAYFDCFSGISGDMTLGALIDLGVPLQWLQEKISGLAVDGFKLEARPIEKNGITAVDFHVRLDGQQQAHRHFSDIRKMIEGGSLPATVVQQSIEIFEVIAVAEAAVHGCSVEDVHFHEVGAVDSIVDIVGTALALHYLEVDKIFSSRVPLGSGFVDCMHGRLPVPAPATLKILADIPVCGIPVDRENVTPTGAAILRALASEFGPIPNMRISRMGYGAGKHEFEDRPNLLRILLGTTNREQPTAASAVTIIESAIDDMNPEYFGYLMEKLFEQGALDVNWRSVYMKKNRPGTGLQVICRDSDRNEIIRTILSETTTTGIRYRYENRVVLERRSQDWESKLGLVRIKVFHDFDGRVRRTPEYEDCRRIARERRMPIRMVYEMLLAELSQENE